MVSPAQRLAARALQWLSGVVLRHRRWFIYPQFLLAVLCVFYTVEHLEFDMSRDNLVGGNKKYHRNFLKFKQEFPLQDDLVVVVESENKEKNRQFVERIGARLEQETNLFTDVVYKGDLKMLGPKALLFLPEKELEDLRKTLQDDRPFLERFSQATNLVAMIHLVNWQFRNAKPEQNAENDALAKALPMLNRVIAQAADSLRRSGTPPSPGIEALFNAGEEAEGQMYVTFSGGMIYLVTARPVNRECKEQAVARLREFVTQTQHEVSGVNVGVTGEPVLEIDEMRQSERDTARATVISFLLVLVIIIYGYGAVSRRIKADLCLLVGLAYTMAFTTLVIGHLNILTVTFAPILIGLAIDFGVHLIARYEEELLRGRSTKEALDMAMVFTGLGIFTGCFTTAGAFLAMTVTNFKGIQEMGIISGGGLLICLVPMMTLLPALLVGERPVDTPKRVGNTLDRRERIETLWLSRPWWVVIIVSALCLAAAIPACRVQFDYDLLNMQSEGLPAVVFEKKLIHSANKSVLFGAIVTDSLEQAVALEAQLTNLTTVADADLGGIDNMSQYLTEDQTRKLALVREVMEESLRIRFPQADPRPVEVLALRQALFSLDGYLRLAEKQTEKEDPDIYRQLLALRTTVEQFSRTIVGTDREQAASKLALFQTALFEDVRETFRAIQNQDASGRLETADLPATLRNRFLGITGKYLVQIYPKKDVWQRENQKEFVQQLREIDPNVTGTPVQLYEYTTLLKNSYMQAAGYSLIAIAILVLIHFRSLSCVILALLPVLVGSLWLVGFMGWFDIPFNPANIMTLPLVIGIGVTNGIHILNRFEEEQKPGVLARSTGKAVLVSGLTTVAGFGSLILAKHQGIASLGYVMSVGVANCMIAGLTFLPAVLTLLIRFGWRQENNRANPYS